MRNLLLRRGKLLKEDFTPKAKHLCYYAEYRLFSKTWLWYEFYNSGTIHSQIMSVEASYMHIQKYTLKDLVKLGNNKLPKTTAIFNMTSAKECPSLLAGECKVADKCYALRDEKLYKTPLMYRRRQDIMWSHMTSFELGLAMLPFLDGVTHFRFNESGDIRTIYDWWKLRALSAFLSGYGIKCYTYTARASIVKTPSKYITVLGSCLSGLDGQFIGVKNAKEHARVARSTGLRSAVCPADCRICTMCPDAKETGMIIYAEIH